MTDQAVVSFYPPVSNGGDPIISYTVTAMPGGITATGPSSPITVYGLTDGVTYTFTVTANNVVGDSAPSAPSNPVTPSTTPNAPTNVEAVYSNGAAQIFFAAPFNGGTPIIDYTATASPGGSSATSGTSPVTMTNLTNGVTYTFTVVAQNANGMSPASLPSNAITPSTIPTTPTIGTATAFYGYAQVTLTPISDGGSPITVYTAVSNPGGITGTSTLSMPSPITINGLTNGITYTFQVSATNANGTSALSAPSNAVTPELPTTVPGAPTALVATPQNSAASVAFTAPATGGSAITSYTVTSSPGALTATGAGSPLTVTGLTNGTAYTFTATATNAIGTGMSSAPSAAVTPAAVPSAPTSVNATAGQLNATVSFTPGASNGAPITNYTATASPGGNSVAGAASPLTVPGLTAETTYTFTVTATNSQGVGAASVPSNAVTPYGIPGAPTAATATGGPNQSSVAFNAPADNGGATIFNYVVTSSRGGAPVSGMASPIVLTGLTNGLPYSFTVQAQNAAGLGPASSPSNVVTPATVPNAPLNPAAAAGNAQAVVSFGAPTTGGSPILNYTAVSSPGGFTVSGPASPLTVTGLTNGTAYTFAITAANAVGSSAPATTAPVTPSASAPGAPLSPAAYAGNAQASVAFSAPVSNGGSAITGYTVTASPGGATASGPASPLTVTGLTNGTAYTFTVTATNAAGTGPASGATAAVTPSGVPSAPTALTATPGNAQASVAFTAAAANGSAVTGYTLTASPGGGTTTGTKSPIIITGLTNGTAYSFTATATNANGVSPASAASNTVTPATVPGAPTGASATPGNATASVAFTAPASNGGSPITSYIVTSSGGQSASGTASPVTVKSLTNGTAYTFTVVAVNSIGSSVASAPSVAVTPTAPAGFVISTTALPSGTAGSAYSGSLAATGGTPPYTYANTTALPAGITLATSGALSGTPSNAGTTTVGFQATDSSGTATYPSSTTVATNDGPGGTQTPQGLQTVSSVALVAGGPTVILTTVATYGSTSAPPHNGRGVQSTNANTYALQNYCSGPYNGEYGNGPAYINVTQESDLWLCANPAAGTTTFQQWFGTAGYGGQNGGDSDYQAFKAYQYPAGSTFLGYGAWNIQAGGSQYPGVPQGTALVSGNITITSAQVPCRLYGFCENTSSLGSNFIGIPNSVAGGPGSTIETAWAFNSGTKTSCYAYWNITQAGTYAASFNQPSTTPNCYQTVCWAVQGAGSGNAVTPVKSIAISIAGGGGYDGTITRSTSLNQMVNSANAVIQARGANFSGLEDSAAQNNPDWYGSPPNWSYWQTWKGNCVRIPLNAASWLGLSCYTINSSGNGWVSTTPRSADPNGTYRQSVYTAVAAAQAVGCYVILDEHWSAPKFTFGGITGYAMPLFQPAMGNSDTSLALHQSLASIFGTQATPQPGINNKGVIIDVFNEPYLDQINGNSNATATWNLMKNGGTQSSFSTNGATTAVAQSWTVQGYQSILNAYRSAGASNLLMFGGCGYSNACSGFATFMPTDTLSPPQTAVSIHLYQAGSSGYPQTYPDTGSGTSSWSTPLKAVLTAGIPVICGESGGTYGSSAANPDPYVAYVTGQADSLGFSYIGWEAWAPVSPSSSGTNNLFTTSNTPTNGQGTTLYNWIVNHNNPSGVAGPTMVQLLLQGQTSQNQATDAGGNNRFQPQNANYTMIGWLSVSGATSYNIYRATIAVGSQATSLTYSSYASISASAAASAYSGYVSGSSGAPYQTGVNCAYGDTAATGCVNGTRGGGSASAPTAGDLWAATGYSYKVSAIVNGVETAQSAAHYAAYIENGLQIMQLATFNNQPSVLNSTAGGTDPLGNTKSIVWNSSASPYWNPYCGNGATEWNLNVRAFNYMEMYIKAAQNDSASLTNAFENEGDNLINNGNGVNFSTYSTPSGNLSSGVWTLVKQPLSVLMTDSTRGRQNAFYKCIPSVNGLSGTWYIGAWRFVT